MKEKIEIIIEWMERNFIPVFIFYPLMIWVLISFIPEYVF